MRVLVTGSKGFIGRNLIQMLQKDSSVTEIMEYDRENTFEELELYCQKADAVFHLAAVLRPEQPEGYNDNISLTDRLLVLLKQSGNNCPIMFSSSIQADLDNPYGNCKRTEEERIIDYGKENGVNAFIFRFPNLFGTMSRPNYTSVVATFCYNTVKALPITVNNTAAVIKFAYIENVLKFLVPIVLHNDVAYANKVTEINKYYEVSLGELAYYMGVLKNKGKSKMNRDDEFFANLTATYEWYEANSDLYDTCQ